MTCIERFRKDYPEHDDLGPYDQGIGCPHDYGYAANTCHGFFSCANCWDQPALGVTVEEEAKETKPIIPNASRESVGLPKIENESTNKDIAQAMRELVDNYEEFKEKMKSKLNIVSPSGIGQIKDSGERRQFDTGAVRDIQEGKGRCDLLPLDVVSNYLNTCSCVNGCVGGRVIDLIYCFTTTSDIRHLEDAIEYFISNDKTWNNNYTMLLEVSKHFEEGAKKYGEYNWQKGIPTHCYIDSAVRHYLKYLRGDTDEPHDRAFVWNILCCIWTCIHKPELNDYRKAEEDV